eukprot:SAG31_NODE_1589_length_7816_cov_5.732279_8_plen_325_part_00
MASQFLVADLQRLPRPPGAAPQQRSTAADAIAAHPALQHIVSAGALPTSAGGAALSPWSLFATEGPRAKLRDAAARLLLRGSSAGDSDQRGGRGEFAVIDGLLGPSAAAAVAADFRQFVGALADQRALAAGELDATGRSNPALRGDLIYWLGGHELGRKWPLVGPMAQLLGQYVGAELRRAGLPLLPPREYAAKAMLSVYPPRSVGFAEHTDRSDVPGDRRLVTAVYYLNPEWKHSDGGSLRISTQPRDAASQQGMDIHPVLDRLVLFWSDSTSHSVAPTASDAAPRLALSFWFLADDQARAADALSPLEGLMSSMEPTIASVD